MKSIIHNTVPISAAVAATLLIITVASGTFDTLQIRKASAQAQKISIPATTGTTKIQQIKHKPADDGTSRAIEKTSECLDALSEVIARAAYQIK